MIRTVCMFYNNDSIEINDRIATFFKLAGLYVSERFHTLNEKVFRNLKMVSDNENIYTDTLSDYNIYFYKDEKDIALQTDNHNDKEKYCCVIINDSLTEDKDIVYKRIENIILNMYHSQLVTEDEYKDLHILNDYYNKNDVYILLAKTSYLYPFVCKSMAGKFIEQYSVVVDGLLTILNGLGLEGWGDDKHRIIQYAALKLAADANIYSKKASLGYLYDSEQLVDNCKLLKKTDRYGNAFVMLEGEINAYILNSNNSAYESYITLCNEEGEYNAYAYYLKGENWKNFRLNIETAVKYFLKSVETYPLYYRAWYMLGEMYTELKKAEKLWNSINRKDNQYFDINQIPNDIIEAIKDGINIKYIYSQIVKIYYDAEMAREGNYYMRLLRE